MRRFEVSTESSHYYAAYNGPVTLPLCVTLALGEAVDRGAMQAALGRAARTYPQYASRVAYADGRFLYVENENPVVLYDGERQSFALGGADTNYYQYRVWAKGDQLGYVCNHGLADGHFSTRFLTTLLYYYAVERGLADDAPLAGVTREGDAPVPPFDPYPRYADLEREPMGTPDIGPIFAPAPGYREDGGDYRCDVDVIDVSTSQLRDLARRSGSRLSPLMMALEARAVYRTWGDASGKSLIGPITNDLRPSFDSAGVGNFSSWVLGVLPAQLEQADLATQCAALQRGMERQLGEDAIRVQMGRSVAAAAADRARPLDECFGPTATAAQRQIIQGTRRYLSLYVSNIGRLRLPEPLDALLVGAEFVLPSFTSTFNLDMVGVGDRVRMTIARSFDDESLTRALVRELQGNGVDASLELRGPRAFPAMGRDAILEL